MPTCSLWSAQNYWMQWIEDWDVFASDGVQEMGTSCSRGGDEKMCAKEAQLVNDFV